MDRTPQDWQPAAPLENLRLRAELLRRVRTYFAAQGVMEVETPILARATVTDIHLASLRTTVRGHGEYFLQTSPEYAMKRLLAAGSGDIYQVARVFRDEECGSLHNPEFTLVEWYRVGFDSKALMADTARLLASLLAELNLSAPEYLTYREAFLTHAALDPLTASIPQLLNCARTNNIPLPSQPPEDRDECLDLLMSMLVGPRLGAGRPTFVHEYPASQAALARLKPDDPRVAERFEIYLSGIELANGFNELTDATEQRTRFQRDLQQRWTRGLPQLPIDERFLSALSAGLPACSGVAVGFDRVLMLAARSSHLDSVISFPVERS